MQAVLKICYIPFLLLINQHQAVSGKNQARAKEHNDVDLLLFENYSLSLSTLSWKNNKTYSKKYTSE